jgi:malonate-semialdehyde dehydrogenase (acetylating)/methylmalonate-semialdehyde dehydrogenase
MTDVVDAPAAVKPINHWISGSAYVGQSGRSGPVFNPATGEQSGAVDFATVEEVDKAVQAAKAAFPAWRATSLAKRAELFFAIRELFHEQREEIAKFLTREHGKVLSDALGEVTRGLEVVEFCCGLPHLLKGGMTDRRRCLFDPPAARCRRGHHPVQLSGDGPDVDVGACDCGR